jgi:GDP-4-dehydro-6-deoxy-D-mannose reductase
MSGPVLVTGASGFVGRRLVRELGRRAIPMVSVGGPDVGEAVDCDLRDRDAVYRLVERYAPATIIHLAAMSSVGQAAEGALQTWDVNFGGTFNLACACAALESDVRFVFASTAEVYGASFLDGPCDEKAPLRPLSTYARSKAAAEWLLRDLASPSLKVLVVRPFNHVGSGQDTRFVVPSFAAQITAAGRNGIVKVGNLDTMRDFSDVDDLIDALVTLAQAPFEPVFGAINIGSGKLRSVRSVLDELIKLSGARIRVEVDPSRLRPSDVPVACGTLDAFDHNFGPRKRRPLNRALRDVLDAARSNVDRQ